MTHRVQTCRYGVFAVVLVSALSAKACSEQPPSPGSSSLPVTVKRLTGARLEHHRSDPKLIWSFTEEEFTLEIGGKTTPAKLIETLTGKRTPVARIEGTWTLDEREGVLILSTVQADGMAVRRRARLSISAAGMVRVDLGNYQFNVFPGKAKLRERRPKLEFKQQGKDLVVSMMIEIPDAPHVVWTHATLVMDHDPYLEGPRRDPRIDSVELLYDVIQCRDDPVLKHMRHRKKKVRVAWRIGDHRKADVPYRVVKQFRPSADELMELAPKLKSIAEQTRQRAPLAVP